MDNRKRMSQSGSAPYPIAALALMLLIVVPGTTTAEESSVFDRITGFFNDRFSSSESEVPKARSLEVCTALSEDAHELMIQRQDGEARSTATKRALEMARKADRSWFFFLRGRIADEFRDNTFAECLSDFQ